MNQKRFFLIPSLLLLSFLLVSFIKNNTEEPNEDKFVVVLDAGHGGHDPGNLGNGYLEKNIALNIVLKVGEILKKNPDIEVIYTRNDDTFIDLYVRGEIANKANADLFVSVHCDSHTSDAHGAGTFVLGLHANKQNFEIAKKENSVIYLEDNYETRYADYDINSPESVIGLTIMQEEFLDQSIALAKTIQDNFSNKLKRNNRKVKQAGFIVLHQTFMPSVLVETGFLTNDSEGAYLNSSKGQSEMGTAIAEAILKYRQDAQGNVSGIAEKVGSSVPDPEKAPEQKKEVAEQVVKEPISEKIEDKKEEVAMTEKVEEQLPETVEKAPEVVELVKEDLPVKKEEAITGGEKPKMEEAVKEEPKMVEKKPEAKKEVVIAAEKKAHIIFKVQLLASSRDLPLRPDKFNGLNRISKEPYKNLFRYMYGVTDSYSEAQLLKSNADIKGYPTSYIVAYKDGIRIPTEEALKYVSE